MSSFLNEVLQANRYVQPILFIVTITVNILNIRVLHSRSLRSSPCTYYFLAYAILSIVYVCLACPTQFLRGFYIDWTNYPIGCPLLYYFLFATPVQAKSMLLLASVDRYCSSSKSRRLHARSTIRTARITIVVAIILTAIYMLPMSFVYYYDKTTRLCLTYSNSLVNIYFSSQIALFYVTAPTLLLVLGLFTVWNIRRRLHRIGVRSIFVRNRRTEGQLARMLLLQTAAHLILVTPFGVTYMINGFNPSTRTNNVMAIRYILVLFQQCDYFVSFFLYVFSASLYRHELMRILSLPFYKTPGLRRHAKDTSEHAAAAEQHALPVIRKIGH